MAQLVKRLQYKHEGLNLDPQHTCKKQGGTVLTGKPNTGQVVTGESWCLPTGQAN